MSKLIELQKKYGEQLDIMDSNAEAGGEAYENAKKSADDILAAIDRVKHAEQAKAAAGQPPENNNPGGLPAQPKKAADKIEPGQMVSRCIIALAANKGIGRLAAEFAQEKWGQHTPEVARALAASVGPSGGFLVPTDMRNELIELLRPASVVMSAGPRMIDLPHGNLTIPGVATGAQAEYVGENQNIKKTEQTFRDVTLSAKKLAALVPISNDMLRYPTISTDQFVRADLIAALAERSDMALLRGDGTQFSPRGLRSWATLGASTFEATGGAATIQVVQANLSKAELMMEEANLPMSKLVWFMSPRVRTAIENLRDGNGNVAFPEMANGRLRGKPVKSTTQIPNNLYGGTGSEIYLADMTQFIIGESIEMEITVQDGAAYHNGTEVISGFSQDQTVIRALTAHDTGLRHAGAVVMIYNVTWAP